MTIKDFVKEIMLYWNIKILNKNRPPPLLSPSPKNLQKTAGIFFKSIFNYVVKKILFYFNLFYNV